MKGHTRLHRLSFLAGALTSAAALTIAWSVGLGTPPAIAQQTTGQQPMGQETMADTHELEEAIQKTQVIAVAYQLDNAGFHALDESLAAGKMVPGALGTVRRARIAAEATTWPDSMRDTEMKLVAEMRMLEDALRDEKVADAAPHAKAVHDLEHDLSDLAYTWLSGAQPMPHDHSEEMPAGH
jgi:hypothetical protein